MKKTFGLFLSSLLACHSLFAEKPLAFGWIDEPGKHVDLKLGKRPLARYVYERMIPEDRQRTYKPFHHVYQSDGEGFLTKGPGGKFTHHRGIYYGFSKCSFTDKKGKKHRVDTWHCKGAYQTHEKFIRSHADSKSAGHTVEIAWRLDDGSVFALETRTLRFSLRPDDSLQIDFESVLSTDHQPLILDGDPQHAGFQFRASDEVASSTARQTYYVRPKEGRDEAGKTKNWPADKDMTNLPWKAQSVVVSGQRHFTLYLDHPENPKPSFYSERDYGRFGSYFKTQSEPGKPVRIKYRLIIGTKERKASECARLSDEFSRG
ncbi:MAG TPA: hypothetical protein DDY76_06495 [Opitutae bacterium]|nr:hypothetical protein [Opitutae bacterium]